MVQKLISSSRGAKKTLLSLSLLRRNRFLDILNNQHRFFAEKNKKVMNFIMKSICGNGLLKTFVKQALLLNH
jgi:hypothetical protein